MLGVLLKFSAFTTLNGFYRQTEGLAMGSKLSPAISNIFLHMLESTTITELLDQKILLFYSRYVCDCLLLVRKRAKNNILSKMNTFDSFLKFTVEEMQNDVLVYLDTKIIKNDDKLELMQHRKTINDTTCMMNYRKSVAPLQYKNSCINGEIYRAYHCTSNEVYLNLALENLEEIFVLNQYPRKLIKNKMKLRLVILVLTLIKNFV